MPKSFQDVFGRGWRSMMLEQRLIGEHIYEGAIRHFVVDDHVGEVVAIDTRSGNWALGKDSTEAGGLLREKCLEVRQVLLMTVGYVKEASTSGLDAKDQ